MEKIEIDADNVDFEKAGEYEAIYQITFDMEALNEWLDENERSSQTRLMKVKDKMLQEAHQYTTYGDVKLAEAEI